MYILISLLYLCNRIEYYISFVNLTLDKNVHNFNQTLAYR